MSESVNNWLKEIAQDRGILAVGVRCNDQKSFAWGNAMDFRSSELDVPLRCLADTFHVIHANKFPSNRIRWTYENAYVHGAMRADGICLGIITRKIDPVPELGALERIISEFETLRL